MPMVQGGIDAINSSSLPRATLGLTKAGLLASLMPCTAKTFFARSILELPL